MRYLQVWNQMTNYSKDNPQLLTARQKIFGVTKHLKLWIHLQNSKNKKSTPQSQPSLTQTTAAVDPPKKLSARELREQKKIDARERRARERAKKKKLRMKKANTPVANVPATEKLYGGATPAAPSAPEPQKTSVAPNRQAWLDAVAETIMQDDKFSSASQIVLLAKDIWKKTPETKRNNFQEMGKRLKQEHARQNNTALSVGAAHVSPAFMQKACMMNTRRRLARHAAPADPSVNLPSSRAGANRRHLSDLPKTKNTRELPVLVRNPLIARFIRESERCINS